LSIRGVLVAIVKRKRDKQHALNVAEEVADLRFRVIEVSAAEQRRITDE
jgi:hypothetical protein